MKTALLLTAVCLLTLSAQVKSQDTIPVFDEVLFYDGYNTLEALKDEMEPAPEGVLRLRTSLITAKLSDEQLALMCGSLQMKVVIRAACDNYDRIGRVYIAMVHKDSLIYSPDETERIEIARFITPFMNKNKQPDAVPYIYQTDYLQHIFNDAILREQYNLWLELEIFGVPYAANTQIAGCSGRNDVFYGSLSFIASAPQKEAVPENGNLLIPLFTNTGFNNYQTWATDTIGQTIKSKVFTIEENLTDAQLVLITSNHGANSGGEEYSRRWHYIYLNSREVLRYMPGRTSCEPFRIYNTQPNGIYGNIPKTDAQWQAFSNWCPGDIIDTRILKLGALSAGDYQFTIEVPDAVFNGSEGNFPLSLYFQGKTDGTIAGKDPVRYTVKGHVMQESGEPLSGVRIGGSFSLTDAAGEFAFVADSNANVKLTPVLSGYRFDPLSITCPQIAAHMNNQNFIAAWNSGIYTTHTGTAIMVYPNPATSGIHIRTGLPKTVPYTLYSVTGQRVQQGWTKDGSTIYIETLAKGMYYLQIADTTVKIIKM